MNLDRARDLGSSVSATSIVAVERPHSQPRMVLLSMSASVPPRASTTLPMEREKSMPTFMPSLEPPRTAPPKNSSASTSRPLLRVQSLRAVGQEPNAAPSDLLDWIVNGPPGTPREGEEYSDRSKVPGKRPLFSASLDGAPVSRYDFSSTSLPTLSRRNSLGRRESFKPSRQPLAASPAVQRQLRTPPAASRTQAHKAPIAASRQTIRDLSTHTRQRAARDVAASTAVGLGLDTSNKWTVAGGMVSSKAQFAQSARRALARNRQLRERLSQALELERVPTPQHVAGRELPADSGLPPSTEGFEVDDTDILTLRYWVPPSAAARMPHYIFHEPGHKVRESLLVLEELRGRGGPRGASRRAGLEARHRQEMRSARQYAETVVQEHDLDRVTSKAAKTVQQTWRGHREEVVEQGFAATTVQKTWRGHNSRTPSRSSSRRREASAPGAARPRAWANIED